jgi:hypothetical protein
VRASGRLDGPGADACHASLPAVPTSKPKASDAPATRAEPPPDAHGPA